MIGLHEFTDTLKYIFYKYNAIVRIPFENF